MPVRFTTTDHGSGPSYLIPAPFININKTFDKQGDGEILGSRYTIQLDGWIVADRGSPKTDGTFIRNGADAIDADVDVQGGAATTGWYEALQNKQKALSNLISKLEAGSFLEVLPLDSSMNGFSANVRLESVDLPSHDPGDPYKSKYTINLSCDYLLGPSGGATSTIVNDEDDWHRREKWMISAASESYQVEEIERSSITRDDSTSTKGEIEEGNRVYSLTRTTSATGKNKFDQDNAYSDGLKSDGFTQKYVENGRAWQQARGYVYDIIKYGNQFIFGDDDTEHTYAGGALPQGKTVPTNTTNDPDDYHLYSLNLPVDRILSGAPPATSGKSYKSFNYKRIPNIDVTSGSFSVTETWILAPDATFATETVEISTQESKEDAEIQVTINGTIEGVLDNADDLGPGSHGTGTNEDKSATREDTVNENLHFDGLNKDTNSKYQNALYHWNTQVFPNLAKTAKGIARLASPTKNITLNASPTQKNLTHQPTQGIITYSITFTASKNESGNSDRYIPYVISEDLSINDTYPGQTFAEQLVLGRRLGPVLQDIGTQTHWLREFTIQCKVNSSDAHICVDTEDEITGSGSYDECITGTCEDPIYKTKSECVAANEIWTAVTGSCEDPIHTTQTDCIAASKIWTIASNQWIANPNYAGIGTSNTARTNSENALYDSISNGQLFTTNMITSKPGYVLPGQTKGLFPGSTAPPRSPGDKVFLGAANGHDFKDAAEPHRGACTDYAGTNDPNLLDNYCHWPKYKQFIAIKKLLNSLDPMTYIGSNYNGGSSINPSTGAGGNQHVTKRFTNAPSESWNPKTGDWSYSISWVYELNDPYTTFSSSFFNSAFVDQLHIPEDASNTIANKELNRTAPGQYF
jgi:hypothetical protein